ncbi:MAG: AbrB/MazE/SpoVT family DNA-binding domain-containing protein [Armatimonadota bacterium]|nr:AbrB/MazE/SpoVT family DNA-binding domain-containing protein [Armatimonadota bacterium]MDR7502316.1 AbrB/MazE/SpoVT family DNA-binding domain-containing protein [Armatimonadota bacterium]MDR7576092.1 AbrB/MazE/SpoVT family DNA-binding domain-containing protein [Armatimonadota bacterium]MDR7584971.1 AbrB/MazE/SpoVT family DNA-binding domain-containing protein [Armatimonadota bacterium]
MRKWGNSLAVRIPKPLAAEAGLEEGAGVDMRAADGRLVLTPVRPGRFHLRTLLARVTKANLHGEIETGGPVGREVW